MPLIAESYCFLVEEDLFLSDVETIAEFLNPLPVRLLCSSSDVTLLDDPADCPNSDELGICQQYKKKVYKLFYSPWEKK